MVNKRKKQKSSMKKDCLAVVILAYNRYEEFPQVLQSVLMQTNIPFHVFVFDDHSDRSLDNMIPKDSHVTYIRHEKRLGFAKNFRFALRYIKERKEYTHTFLLGDDDIIVYPKVLYDLYSYMQKDPLIHVVRGGFVEFVNTVSNITRLYTYSEEEIKVLSCDDQIKTAATLFIFYYSGLLFKNELFQPDFSPYDDLVTPFTAPLLNILLTKKFAFLAEKITLYVKTEHKQLATYIYNEKVSGLDGMSLSYALVGRKYKKEVTIFELINYKIYSNSPSKICEYYSLSISCAKGLRKLLFIAVYMTPVSILKFMKTIIKNGLGMYSKYIINKYHPYIRLSTHKY
jgi:glycosyltransferase involved in cell wall biosynthesis